MEEFDRKTLTTSRGLTYTYYLKLTPNENVPTLLLQHGFPDDHSLWAKVVPHLLNLQYPILVPDLLGYSGTSKPTDPSLYNSKEMANDLAEILDHEGIEKIVSIGHDWGSFMAQRMWLWHPDRVAGVILLNAAYAPPAAFDLGRANTVAEKTTGLPRLAYWYFLVAEDGAQLMRQNIDSAWAALHGSPEDWLETMFCRRDALREFIENDKRVSVRAYAEDPIFKNNWMTRFKRDGFEAPVQWYFALVNGHHWAVEKELPPERLRITVPLLFIGSSGDAACLTDAIYGPQKLGLLPYLTVKEVDGGHWQTLEVPQKSAKLMAEWLQSQGFGVSQSRL